MGCSVLTESFLLLFSVLVELSLSTDFKHEAPPLQAFISSINFALVSSTFNTSFDEELVDTFSVTFSSLIWHSHINLCPCSPIGSCSMQGLSNHSGLSPLSGMNEVKQFSLVPPFG